MQPTLRHTPPRRRVALDQHHLLAEVGGAERRGVAAGSGAQHQHFGVQVGIEARERGGERFAQPRLCGAALAACAADGGGGSPGAGGLSAHAGGAAGDRRAGAAAASEPSVSRIAIKVPCETLSPILTFTSFTVPACVEGTSIVALSLSSVTSESSLVTLSPGFTSTSMTGTSLKSPMSGTLISMAAIGAL